MVFGLFKMLGYRFSPRFRDLADQRFWRAEIPGGDLTPKTSRDPPGTAGGTVVADAGP
jgi:hypothetical protein